MTASDKTYEIGPDGAWIRCLICNLTSHNPNDVTERYCGNCHVFHEDLHKKTLLRIDEVFVFVASDHNGEGVPAFADGNMMLPLVCADKARVDSLRSIAKQIARESGNKITLCRFSLREEIEVIEP